MFIRFIHGEQEMASDLKENRKQCIAEIEIDLHILKGLQSFPAEKATRRELEERIGKDFTDDILPVVNKYDLYVHILNDSELVWKPKIKTVVKELEKELNEANDWLKKNSWLHNPNPWILRIGTGLLLLFLGFLLGKYFGNAS